MKDETKENWTIFGSVGAAAAAAICCLGPIVLVSLGVTGAWIGALSGLESYRPLFMAVSAGLLFFAFYKVYGGDKENCEEGEQCEVRSASKANRIALWVAAIAVVALFFSPSLVAFSEDDIGTNDATEKAGQSLSTLTLEIDGMTCSGCTSAVRQSLQGVDGVSEVSVSFEPPLASIRFDSAVTSSMELKGAISDIGYSAKILE